MKPKINFITVSVSDIVKSKNFYQNAFNFSISEENDELCLFELNDDFYFVIQQQSEFIKQTDKKEVDTLSSRFILSHNATSQQEVEKIVEQAEKYGGIRVKTLDETWGYSVCLLYTSDAADE